MGIVIGLRVLERLQVISSGTAVCVTSDGGFDCFDQISESSVKGIEILLR